MKKVIIPLLVGCLALSISAVAAVDWQNSYVAALARAKKDKKLVMVDIYATWCLPCKQLEKETFANKDVEARLSNQVISVKLDLEKILDNTELAKQFARDTIPYVVFLDSDGKKLSEFVGFLTADEFLKELDKTHEKATKQ